MSVRRGHKNCLDNLTPKNPFLYLIVLTGEVCLGLPKLSLLWGIGLPTLSFLPGNVGGLPKLSLLAGTVLKCPSLNPALPGDNRPSLEASDNLAFKTGEVGGDCENLSNEGSFFSCVFLVFIGLSGGVVNSSLREAWDDDSDTTDFESDLESFGLRLLMGDPVLGDPEI